MVVISHFYDIPNARVSFRLVFLTDFEAKCGKHCRVLSTSDSPTLGTTIVCWKKTRAGSAQALRILKRICIEVCPSMLDINPRRVSLPSAEFCRHILSRILSWDIVK